MSRATRTSSCGALAPSPDSPRTANVSSALPAVGAETGHRTSTDPFAGRAICRFASAVTLTPVAASVASTSPAASPFELTTMPASIVSPARRKRGSAGRAISGRLATTSDCPKPKRSSAAATTAMRR